MRDEIHKHREHLGELVEKRTAELYRAKEEAEQNALGSMRDSNQLPME